jgi:uncharacterized protein DUF4336
MTGYEPLNILKPVAPDIWLIDGPAIRFYGIPFSTRATVVRLKGGDLWVHSPTKLTKALRAEVSSLGPVRHLIAPNWIHYAYVNEWQAAFAGAISWAAPGVEARAASRGMALAFDHALTSQAEAPWQGQIKQMIVEGSRVHREVVFFHKASRTLILTDLIENFEPAKLVWWMRPVVRLAGIADPDGQMPRDMRATFRANRGQLRACVEQMIAWAPERIILAHGRWYETGGVAELRRAFRFVL